MLAGLGSTGSMVAAVAGTAVLAGGVIAYSAWPRAEAGSGAAPALRVPAVARTPAARPRVLALPAPAPIVARAVPVSPPVRTATTTTTTLRGLSSSVAPARPPRLTTIRPPGPAGTTAATAPAPAPAPAAAPAPVAQVTGTLGGAVASGTAGTPLAPVGTAAADALRGLVP